MKINHSYRQYIKHLIGTFTHHTHMLQVSTLLPINNY